MLLSCLLSAPAFLPAGAASAPGKPLAAPPGHGPVDNPLDRLIADGQKFYEAEEYERAARLFSYAAAKYPQSERPHICLAVLSLKQKQPDQSSAQADVACRLNPKSAQAHFLKGQNLLLKDKSADAECEFKEALRLDPTLPHCHYILGRLYEEQGAADKAMDQYKLAISQDADVRWALEALKEHLTVARCDATTVFPLEALARMLVASGHSEAALPLYKQAIALRPSCARLDLQMGCLLAGLDDKAALTVEPPAEAVSGNRIKTPVGPRFAIHYLKEALRLNPGDLQAMQELLTVYGAVGDWRAAADTAAQWAQTSPDSISALWNLALCKLICGEFYEANSALEAALSLDPNNCELHNLQFLVFSELGRTKDADAQLNAALKLTPDYLPAVCNQIMSGFLTGHTADAAENMEQLSRKYPQIQILTSAAALLDAENGKWQQAQEKATEQIKSNPSDDLAFVALATAAAGQGRLKDEIDLLDEAMRLQPQNTLVVKKLCAAYLRQGDFKAAADEAQKGLQLAPGNLQLKHALALALGKQGNWYGAAFLLKEALAKAPKDADLHADLGYALEMKAEVEDAQSEYEQALRLAPQAVSARLGLARLALLSKHYGESIKQTEEILLPFPFNDEARLLHAEASYRLGKYEDSIRDCGIALQHDNGNTKANCLMGRSLYQVHRWSNSLPYLWMCIGKPDAAAEDWLLAATAMKNTKDNSGAQSVAQSGLSNYPDYKPLLDLMSQLTRLSASGASDESISHKHN